MNFKNLRISKRISGKLVGLKPQLALRGANWKSSPRDRFWIQAKATPEESHLYFLQPKINSLDKRLEVLLHMVLARKFGDYGLRLFLVHSAQV